MLQILKYSEWFFLRIASFLSYMYVLGPSCGGWDGPGKDVAPKGLRGGVRPSG